MLTGAGGAVYVHGGRYSVEANAIANRIRKLPKLSECVGGDNESVDVLYTDGCTVQDIYSVQCTCHGLNGVANFI
jgi:hypothetical protein